MQIRDWSTSIAYAKSVDVAYIPMPKGRGFTPLFDKSACPGKSSIHYLGLMRRGRGSSSCFYFSALQPQPDRGYRITNNFSISRIIWLHHANLVIRITNNLFVSRIHAYVMRISSLAYLIHDSGSTNWVSEFRGWKSYVLHLFRNRLDEKSGWKTSECPNVWMKYLVETHS